MKTESRSKSDVRKKLFTMRVVQLEEVAQRSCGCPFLKVFKAGLDRALSNLVQGKGSLPTAEGLELDAPKGPF